VVTFGSTEGHPAHPHLRLWSLPAERLRCGHEDGCDAWAVGAVCVRLGTDDVGLWLLDPVCADESHVAAALAEALDDIRQDET